MWNCGIISRLILCARASVAVAKKRKKLNVKRKLETENPFDTHIIGWYNEFWQLKFFLIFTDNFEFFSIIFSSADKFNKNQVSIYESPNFTNLTKRNFIGTNCTVDL